MQWLNPPAQWQQEAGCLTVVTDPETDFWRVTFYGFTRDNGHFAYETARGDFSAGVRFDADYEALYDQAGLMVRVDEENWIKAGVEYADGRQNLSAVVTRGGYSDWSILPLPAAAAPAQVWLRLTRHAEAIRLQHSFDGQRFELLRLAYLPGPEEVAVGPMCCSPQRGGFRARFHDFQVGPPIARELHG